MIHSKKCNIRRVSIFTSDKAINSLIYDSMDTHEDMVCKQGNRASS